MKRLDVRVHVVIELAEDKDKSRKVCSLTLLRRAFPMTFIRQKEVNLT